MDKDIQAYISALERRVATLETENTYLKKTIEQFKQHESEFD